MEYLIVIEQTRTGFSAYSRTDSYPIFFASEHFLEIISPEDRRKE